MARGSYGGGGQSDHGPPHCHPEFREIDGHSACMTNPECLPQDHSSCVEAPDGCCPCTCEELVAERPLPPPRPLVERGFDPF